MQLVQFPFELAAGGNTLLALKLTFGDRGFAILHDRFRLLDPQTHTATFLLQQSQLRMQPVLTPVQVVVLLFEFVRNLPGLQEHLFLSLEGGRLGCQHCRFDGQQFQRSRIRERRDGTCRWIVRSIDARSGTQIRGRRRGTSGRKFPAFSVDDFAHVGSPFPDEPLSGQESNRTGCEPHWRVHRSAVADVVLQRVRPDQASCESSDEVSLALLTTPTNLATTCPPLNSNTVGMAVT